MAWCPALCSIVHPINQRGLPDLEDQIKHPSNFSRSHLYMGLPLLDPGQLDYLGTWEMDLSKSDIVQKYCVHDQRPRAILGSNWLWYHQFWVLLVLAILRGLTPSASSLHPFRMIILPVPNPSIDTDIPIYSPSTPMQGPIDGCNGSVLIHCPDETGVGWNSVHSCQGRNYVMTASAISSFN